MNARLNVPEIGATNGRNGSVEDCRGRVVTDDNGCGRGLCPQQYVAGSTTCRSYQRCLWLPEVPGRSGNKISTGAAETRGADSEISHSRIPNLSRGRQKAEDAETASAFYLQYDAGRIPLEMGARPGLSYG